MDTSRSHPLRYAELHLHTAYSLLDGASLPRDLVQRAQELGYRALAVTDHDSLGGAMEFAQACKSMGIQPITGAEVTLADGSHLTLLAERRIGYGNLCRLLTASLHGRPPAVGEPDDAPRLASYAEGLILLTGCRDGLLAQLIDADRAQEARRLLGFYATWFGPDNVFIELQHNMVYGDMPRIRKLVRLAHEAGLPYVATGNVHYHDRDRYRLQDVLVSIRHNTTLDGSGRWRRPNSEFALRSPVEMAERFRDFPQAIISTNLIAERCAGFDLTADLGYSFPDFGTSSSIELARVCWAGLAQRYPEGSQYRDRAQKQLTEELGLIERHKLSGFFLTYRDLLDRARRIATELRGGELAGSRRFLPPGRGRGSAVSSIVCHLIGLSPVDPITHDLYVGRFLNDRMSTVPDIDLDLPREVRAQLIEEIIDTYGHEHAAMVSAYATYRLPSAVRDIGKALGLPAIDLDRVAKLSERGNIANLGAELARIPDLANRADTHLWQHLVALSAQLAGHPRHITQHSGGMVISSTPLDQIVPIQPAAMEGRYIVQWDKDSCADAGLIKVDLLALGALSQVEECLDLIDTHQGHEVDLSRIDYADPAVYAMIQSGDTIGTFQIESRAQIQMVRRTKPENLQDLIVQVAIVRPGPIIGGAVTPFVQRRLDPDFVPVYDHPSLEPVLRETLGVVLYQEQVIQVAEVLAGFTAGQADQFRRAMTRKRSMAAMEEMRQEFLDGARSQGVDQETAVRVFERLTGFAEYGFPKSHAAAFGLLAYQTAWLKHYFPAEFLCSLLNNQPMGFYAPHVLVNDARHRGIRVLRPDLNLSGENCTVEGTRTVRIGLSLIKEVRELGAAAIVAEHDRHGPFRSLGELVRRVVLPFEQFENLIGAGALDGFGMRRRELLWQLGLLIPSRKLPTGRHGHKDAGKQIALALPTVQDHVTLRPVSTWDRAAEAYRTLGLSLLPHPIGLLRHRLPGRIVSSAQLEHLPNGSRVRLPGLVVCRQRPETAKGITFLSLEDEYGLANVIVYPNLYERQRAVVRAEPFVIVTGRLQRQDENINIIAEHMAPIDTSVMQRPTWSGDRDDRREDADTRWLATYPVAPDQPIRPTAHNFG